MKTLNHGHAKQNTVGGRGEKSVRAMNPDRRPERSAPASRRPAQALGYDAFAADVLRKLNPDGPIEALVADRVVESAWQLKAATDRQPARSEVAEGNPDKAPSQARRASAADRAMRSMREALETLDALQSTRPAPTTVAPVVEFAPEPEPETAVVAFDPFFDGDASEWTIPPFDVPVSSDPSGDAPIWKDRLVFDFEVSDFSPVVKGTWVTVSHVVTLIVDGHTWADILRTHPELTEDDVHACMAYALDELNDPK